MAFADPDGIASQDMPVVVTAPTKPQAKNPRAGSLLHPGGHLCGGVGPHQRSSGVGHHGGSDLTRYWNYAGSAESFAGLRVVAANDDVSPSDLTSQVIFQPETRTTYYIAIDGYGSATGNVRLELRPASAAVLAIRLKKPDLVSLLISNTSARPMIYRHPLTWQIGPHSRRISFRTVRRMDLVGRPRPAASLFPSCAGRLSVLHESKSAD